MPDWSYHPLLRPLFRRLPPRAQARALQRVGSFGASRAGGRVVAVLGHAEPPSVLRRAAWGRTLRSPLGVGASLPQGVALAPFVARLGVGFVEAGPFSTLREAEEARGRLARAGVPVGVRLDPRASVGEQARVVAQVASWAAFVTVAPPEGRRPDADAWAGQVAALVAAAGGASGAPVVVAVEADAGPGAVDAAVGPALARGARGVLVDGPQATCEAEARRLRAAHGEGLVLVASASGGEPADAVALLDAGATLVQVDQGLARSGPGLPKRVHEALLHRRQAAAPPTRAAGPTGRGWLAPWVGTLLLGIGMVVCGSAAWAVAATSVVLPYDLAFLGMTRDELAAVDAQLLPFLAHDRVTLAGTMVSIGILYALLAAHAQRHGAAWARHAVVASASVGFASFFLFLGFGYFDPLHAAISLALLPFLLWGARGSHDRPPPVPAPDLRDDRAWRRALWGQLGLVAIGGGLVLAGVVIALVGSTAVFVPEDLAFMGTSAERLAAANERLLALVAHDRAGFGGALVSEGIAVVLAAVWGVRRGARWLWWTLAAAGAAGFGGALGIHLAVGYLDAWHLFPAVLALALLLASLWALRPYLVDRGA